MKTITISRRARGINDLLKKARREIVILQAPDGDEFVLAEIDDFDREIELTRKNGPLMKLLDLRAAQTKTISLEAAKAHLGLTKKSSRGHRN